MPRYRVERDTSQSPHCAPIRLVAGDEKNPPRRVEKHHLHPKADRADSSRQAGPIGFFRSSSEASTIFINAAKSLTWPREFLIVRYLDHGGRVRRQREVGPRACRSRARPLTPEDCLRRFTRAYPSFISQMRRHHGGRGQCLCRKSNLTKAIRGESQPVIVSDGLLLKPPACKKTRTTKPHLKSNRRRKLQFRRPDPLRNSVRSACADLTSIRIAHLLALAELKRGNASGDTLRVLAAAIGTSERLARAGVGPEALSACQAARRALTAIAVTNGTAADADIAAVTELYSYWEAQVAAATGAEFASAAAPFHSTDAAEVELLA